VGDILYKLGNNDEAEWFYNKMLKQDSLDDITRGILLSKIGRIRLEKKDFTIALHKFKEAAKLLPPSITASDNTRASRPLYVCIDESPLIAIYNNMGLLYKEDCDFEKSVNCYKQALAVKDGLPSELAIVHNNLGLLYYSRGKYTEAQQHHMEAFALVDESDSKWKEFKENLDSANHRFQHVYNKTQHCQMQTTINKLIQ
jgi:tetratricopeptide (TPR) repeat protein